MFTARLPAHQTQGHGQAMVDIHLVDDGQVEIVLDHRLRDMRRQFGMTDHGGHWPRTPAFVGRRVTGSGADRKGRDHVQTESCCMVVVDQEDHVGSVVGHPLLGDLVAFEQRLPVSLVVFPQVKRCAYRGDMRGEDAGGDLGHQLLCTFLVSPTYRLPSTERPPASIIAAYSSCVMPVMLAAMYWKLLPSVAPILARK